ncbi:DNA mismatch endonuclease Vsr [Bradyrhizobium sp. NBAIM03]|uniref:very short patch repair endonuclease n=1 Tax=Bradyrhizobium sp. NBAIM03 TaxID=2793816 RepID=UPI001CD3F1E3|nr:DNA mismatch endonuclease Vsr [Bradyrhizobium sp. NBAIM03]MCA1535047.1 DNA mismatch endonuclease Vsr [Bradyrhizobium sp. NBAIM03]
MDHITPARRSWLMSRVKSRNTGPELRVRKVAHALGYRFTLHSSSLPGKPDLTFPRLRSVIFVHGCFWHRHQSCSKASMPNSRPEFWAAKFKRNVERDTRVRSELRRRGWRVCVVWECETKKPAVLRSKVRRFLSRSEAGASASSKVAASRSKFACENTKTNYKGRSRRKKIVSEIKR